MIKKDKNKKLLLIRLIGVTNRVNRVSSGKAISEIITEFRKLIEVYKHCSNKSSTIINF